MFSLQEMPARISENLARQRQARQALDRVNGVERALGNRAFQIQFYTTNLRQEAEVGANLFPILVPSTHAAGRKLFEQDVILLGAYLSLTWFTAAADEVSMIGIAKEQTTNLNGLGDANTFIQSTLDCFAADDAGVKIQRNIGTMFAPPFVPVINQNGGLRMFGSNQTDIDWRCTGTIYYCRLQDYLAYMNS